MKKSVIILIAAIAIIAVGAASTMAWFIFTTPTKTNTFTVGKVEITLTEPVWDAETDSLLVPGKKLTKDPTVTVVEGSEKCYVFVKIVTAAGLEKVIEYTVNTPAWIALEGYDGVYYQIVDKNTSADTVLPVLKDNTVTIPTTIEAADLSAVTGSNTMVINAYAIQWALTEPHTPVSAWEILFPPTP